MEKTEEKYTGQSALEKDSGSRKTNTNMPQK
jgi:hypothetical protein